MFHVVDMLELKVLTDGILGNSLFMAVDSMFRSWGDKTINNILSMFRWIKCSLNQVVNDEHCEECVRAEGKISDSL